MKTKTKTSAAHSKFANENTDTHLTFSRSTQTNTIRWRLKRADGVHTIVPSTPIDRRQNEGNWNELIDWWNLTQHSAEYHTIPAVSHSLRRNTENRNRNFWVNGRMFMSSDEWATPTRKTIWNRNDALSTHEYCQPEQKQISCHLGISLQNSINRSLNRIGGLNRFESIFSDLFSRKIAISMKIGKK